MNCFLYCFPPFCRFLFCTAFFFKKYSTTFKLKSDNLPNGVANILYKGGHVSGKDAGYAIGVRNESGDLKFYGGIGTGNPPVMAYSPTVINLNKWYYGVVTYNGSNLLLYLDGVLVYDQVKTGNIIHKNNALCIGKRNDPWQDGFIGSIDEVRIWNRALTSQEISGW